MNDEQRKRLADKSGDSNNARPPKYEVPLIRFDGNTGKFKKVTKNKDGENVDEALTKPLEFVVLKKRRLLSSYSKKLSYFTNEHNNTNDKLMLFKFDGSVSLQDTGFTDELRAKYQTLKTHEVVYILMDGEVCKMEIKGGSLGGYYDYQKALKSEEKHSFEVLTIVDSAKAESEGGFDYFKMTFDFKPLNVDFDTLETKIDEVAKACEESDNYTKQKLNEKSRGSVGSVNGDTTVNGLSPEQVEKIQSARQAEKDYQNYGKGDSEDSDIPF